MSVMGMSCETGRRLNGFDHLRQSIRDILTTPIGSRVMRRDYGSDLPDLVDSNVNGVTIARFYAATVDALRKWEPRLRVDRVQLEQIGEGRVEIALEGTYLPDGTEIRIDGVVL